MGTVIAIGGQAGFLDARGNLPRLKRVLLVDSLAAVWGGVCGASSVTTYIESAAGVSLGGRTGLVSVVTGGLVFIAMWFAPLVGAVPSVATAPALVIVGFVMLAGVSEMDLTSVEEGFPAFITLLLMPLTESISCGIGAGFLMFVLVKLLRGRIGDVSPWLGGLALVFLANFLWGRW